jgi:Leucine Rich Repeat
VLTNSNLLSIRCVSSKESLFVYENLFNGTLPGAIFHRSLLRFQGQNNLFRGTIPEEVYTESTNLVELQLHYNGLGGTISSRLGNLGSLEVFNIGYNSFSGTLPAELARLSRLSTLFRSQAFVYLDQSSLTRTSYFCGFTSPLPIFVTGALAVNNNRFEGTIRDSFDNFGSLTFADYGMNMLSGLVPESIFAVPTLETLYLSDNDLSGSLPAAFAAAPVLRDLFLDTNMLAGTVPSIASDQLRTLTRLRLEENLLTGTMPASICLLRGDAADGLQVLQADCAGSRPKLECFCCTGCFPMPANATTS